MPYFVNTPDERQAMLAAIGAASVEELFAMVPGELRLGRDLCLPPALGELELTAELTRLAGLNMAAGEKISFLGAGSYDHFIPAVVDFVAGRSEFYTSYTPYQAEVSQGNLQALFEYQTLITQLTGLDVSNSSLYDGGSAAAEAALMALDVTGRNRVLVPQSLHPEYRQTLRTYLANLGVELTTLATPGGALSPADLEAAVDDQTACVLVQQPNFFGCLEEMQSLAEIAHRAGALLVAAVDPISLGLLKRPGDCGADVAVAEGQVLGNPLAFGGPYLGIMACRERFVRRMPGRLIGQTVDRRGRRCWALTLQTREQHIRREKATSNICTNQALLALRASVYLAAMGPSGLRAAAELCLQKAHYAAGRLTESGAFSLAFERPMFKEFVLRVAGRTVEQFLDAALAHGIFAGVHLGRWYPELSDCLLVAVTEKRTKQEIDRLAAI
ncbi:MAG: aminomethyl-transferring glycine dehydrogenase subunit GcvPA [Thermoguttaceae bacterium]|jgi:glycine dehydrogenase subunit 1